VYGAGHVIFTLLAVCVGIKVWSLSPFCVAVVGSSDWCG
jgi:hypothetical protein